MRAFMNDVYARIYSVDSNAFLDECALLSGGKICRSAAPPQDGWTLVHWRYVTADSGGGAPAPAYWWSLDP